jgi:hypothetical protein
MLFYNWNIFTLLPLEFMSGIQIITFILTHNTRIDITAAIYEPEWCKNQKIIYFTLYLVLHVN